MQYFDQMGFGQAVSLVQNIGVLMHLMFLSLPVAAAIAIRRGKRNRPGDRLLFPRLVFWGWFALLAAAIAYFFTGAWYGENGPPPQQVAAQATIALACFTVLVAAIYFGLYRTTNPRDADPSHAA